MAKQDGKRIKYSDKDLKMFEKLINEKLVEARANLDQLKKSLSHADDNSTEDTAPTFKMMEDGSETLSREETAHQASRMEKFIKHLEDALVSNSQQDLWCLQSYR